jgi:VanZ family protein
MEIFRFSIVPPRFQSPMTTISPGVRWHTLAMWSLFFGYFAYLTLLLLAPNPYRWVGSSPGRSYFLSLLYPFAHGISFALLTVFARLAFRALRRVLICVILSGYAAVTEFLQMFFPPRTAELQDFLQDIAGIAVGILSIWILTVGEKTPRNVPEEACSESTM